MSLICLLTYAYRKQRRRARNSAETQFESESASYATNLSVVCVCSDSVGERQQHNSCTKAGEDTALLNDWSDRVAYS